MSFIIPVPDADATGATRDLYDQARQASGQVLNLHRAFAHLPFLAGHFEQMTAALKSHMGLRRYELVTLATAMALRSSYCALAHGSVLLQAGMAPEDLLAIVTDTADAPVSDVERAMMDYAEAIVHDATDIGAERIADLREHGLDDAEISAIAAAAALRCYFSKYLDALGTEADGGYAALPDELRDALTPGRPIQSPG